MADTTDAHLVQLAVGEHVAVDEAAPLEVRPFVARRPADRVVEQPSLRPQQRVQVGEVLVQARLADVLEHADRADGVERPVGDRAVVLQAELDAVAEAADRPRHAARTRAAARDNVMPTASTP